MTAAHALAFIAGLFIGTAFGVFLMCLFQIRANRTRRDCVRGLLVLTHQVARWDNLGLAEFLPEFTRPAMAETLERATRLHGLIVDDPVLFMMLHEGLEA